jgi:serine/threonine protein phosphatase PrpC
MMALKTNEMSQAELFLEANLSEVAVRSFLGGEACVFTAPSPDKETPNEDAAALLRFDESSGLLVVADGVGGYRLGNEASAATVRALQDSLKKGAAEGALLRTAILNGIETANQAVLDLGVGAATTLALTEVLDDKVRPYHIGDSTVIIVGQRGKLKAQTVSHSPVGFAIEAGVLDEKEAMHHEDRHLVSNIIGTPEMRIEIGSIQKLSFRDTVLLGSDGLFDNLHLTEIVELIRKGPLQLSVQKLVEASQQRMSSPREGHPSKPDDLTVVAFRRTTRS